MTAYHQQAQWGELLRLKEVIGEVHNARKHQLRILDIGIGFGRIPRLLSRVDTWEKIAEYIGIDISEFSVATSKRIITSLGIADKVEVILFDATKLSTCLHGDFWKEKFDVALCTYFTAGDFQPGEITLQTAENGLIADYDINALEPNKNFVAVFKGAYQLLRDNGRIVIGSAYRDSDLARRIQEDFYRKCGMTVITTSKDPFTATKQGFWSQRFDKGRIYDYLSWVPSNKIRILPLDDYDFALTIVIDR
jgi:SAM-dependent methyltransferase